MVEQNAINSMPATAQPLAAEDADNSVETDITISLSPDKEENFNKYAHKYGISNGFTKEKQDNIDRQKYVYSALNTKSIDDTAVEKLLDLTISDINHQYTVKNAIEGKAGFLIALWGVLLGILLNNKLYVTLIDEILNTASSSVWRVFNLLILLGLLISAFGALFQIAKILISGVFHRFRFDEKEINFKCAVDDKNMMLTKLLDANTNAWTKNEQTNDNKFKHLNNSVKWIFFLILFMVISISVQLYIEENTKEEKYISVKVHMEGENNDEETIENQVQYETITTE